MSQFVGTWNMWWADSQAGTINQTTLSLAMKPDGDLNGTFSGSQYPFTKVFTGSLSQDVVGDGEILSGLFNGGEQNGFTFLVTPAQPNFLTGAIGVKVYGWQTPVALYGIRQTS